MSKKKRKPLKPSPSRPLERKPSDTRNFKRILVFSVLAIVLALAATGFYFRFSSRTVATNIIEMLDQIDFMAAEPQVASKIRSLGNDVKRELRSPGLWGKLAMNLDVHDFKMESVECYKQAMALDSKDFRWPYFCAIVLSEIGSPEALLMFKRTLRLDSNYAPLHIRYGKALFDASELSKAEEEYGLALAADANSSHAYLGLARIALARGKLQDCENHLWQALKIDPNHGELHGLLSEVYRRSNQREDAELEMAINRELPKEKLLPDLIYKQVTDEGVSSGWFETRGRAYMMNGLYPQAVQELESAVKAKPSARAYDVLGVVYQKMGNYQQAERCHRQAIVLNPEFTTALINLSTALSSLNKVEEAIAYSEKARGLDPNLEMAYLNLGLFYSRLGKPEEAVEVYREGRERLPDRMQIALRLAWLLATASQSSVRNGPEAVTLAEMLCKESNYQDPEELDVLAAAYAATGEFGKAIQTAETSIKLAMDQKRPDMANGVQQHLSSFRKQQPWRQ